MGISLKPITKYRTEIMGIAILLVVLFHSNIVVSSSNIFAFYLKKFGFGGVDIFFFLSGLGLYYSYSKDRLPLPFMKKRFWRVLPSYWFIILLFTTIYNLQDKSYFEILLYRLTTWSFWANKHMFDWYIPGSLLLYLLFPSFYYLLDQAKYKGIVVAAISVLCVWLSSLIAFGPLAHLLIFTTRIPVFFLGSYSAYLIKEEHVISLKHLFFMMGMFLLSFIYLFVSVEAVENQLPWFWGSSLLNWLYGSWWYAWFVLAPVLCFFFGYGFSFLEQRGVLWLGKFFRFFGILSLEIYLMHPRIFNLAPDFQNYFSFDSTRTIEHSFYFIITVVSSYLLFKLKQWMDFKINLG